MLCQQLGYQLANNCMILCDPELSVGLNTSGEKTAVAPTRGRGGAWTPVGVNANGQPGTANACIFGLEDVRELAGKGHEIASKVKEGFSDIAQEMYKVCSTSFSKFQVLTLMRIELNRSQLLPRMICYWCSSHLILPTVCSPSLRFCFLRVTTRQLFLHFVW